MYKVPILLLVFNRPKNIKKVIQILEKIKPSKIYISADGPRINKLNDKKFCNETKNLFKSLNWKCDVKKNYLKSNFGCREAVSKGISWFFKNEKYGIILEDDCLPNLDFFKYCEINLKKYYNNKKVGCITGNNFQKIMNVRETYYFSKYPHCWGWATWRKSWKVYKKNIDFWPTYKKSLMWLNHFNNDIEQKYWTKIFDKIYARKIDSWAYPWSLCLWKNDMLTITPRVNLVKNIGFGKEATHTVSSLDDQKYQTNKLPKKWLHPKKIVQHINNDNYVFINHLKGINYIWPYRFFYLFGLFCKNPSIFFIKLKNNFFN